MFASMRSRGIRISSKLETLSVNLRVSQRSVSGLASFYKIHVSIVYIHISFMYRKVYWDHTMEPLDDLVPQDQKETLVS